MVINSFFKINVLCYVSKNKTQSGVKNLRKNYPQSCDKCIYSIISQICNQKKKKS